MPLSDQLAAVNAILNGTASVLMVGGWLAIRNRNVRLHKAGMIGAFVCSIFFLISYLTRVSVSGIHSYTGTGVVRTIYLAILATHVILAAAVPVLTVRTIYLAVKERLDAHRKWARVTFPIWTYVSVTGVVIYFFIYG